MGFICISLMIREGEHLFICEPFAYLFHRKSLFKFFVHFLVGLFTLWLLNSLYILDINPLSDA